MAKRAAPHVSRERICEMALRGFAEKGVAATSIREVAAAAGVSPGLVQHHFATKEELREAAHELLLARVEELFAEPPSGGSAEEIQRELGDRVTRFAGERPEALRYVARLAAEEDPLALELFDAFLKLAEEQWESLAREGALRADVDIEWAALQAVVLVLGSALFEGAIGRHLPAPWRDPEQLERWNRANSSLFRQGIYKGPEQTGAWEGGWGTSPRSGSSGRKADRRHR
jgi:TetR/AcrR family transcriptional regulator, regulator of cefoperazone and chloramphenicol sensitivity